MTKPTIMSLLMIMFSLLMITMMTTKTSIMCLNLTLFTLLASTIISMKIMLTPIPFIMFLTMIGGLMIIFLYLAATLWTKKENLTLKMKILFTTTLLAPLMMTSTSTKYITMPPLLNMFNPPLNTLTMLLMILLTLMLVFTIEIHTKTNLPFRRKLKIWT